jgi:hypothetical protein
MKYSLKVSMLFGDLIKSAIKHLNDYLILAVRDFKVSFGYSTIGFCYFLFIKLKHRPLEKDRPLE